MANGLLPGGAARSAGYARTSTGKTRVRRRPTRRRCVGQRTPYRKVGPAPSIPAPSPSRRCRGSTRLSGPARRPPAAGRTLTIESGTHPAWVSEGARRMPGRPEPMKDVPGCDKPRGAAGTAVIRGSPNGATHPGSCPGTSASRRGGNRGNGNISLPRGGEINRDSPSSGERTGNSPNRCREEACWRCGNGVVGPSRRGSRPATE